MGKFLQFARFKSLFLFTNGKNVMDAHRSCLLGDGFFLGAPRTNYKMDGFESFSNIIHIV